MTKERNVILKISLLYNVYDSGFLTKQTVEGLNITLQSTIDLVNVLLNNYEFNYVLTAKINWDCLEVLYFK